MIAFCLIFIEARCATGGRNTCLPGFSGTSLRSLIYNVLSDGREIPQTLPFLSAQVNFTLNENCLLPSVL